MNSDEDALRETMKSDFGLDPQHGFAYKRELAKVLKAWNIAKVQSEAKVKADAAARARGVPITMLEPDWASLRQPHPLQLLACPVILRVFR